MKHIALLALLSPTLAYAGSPSPEIATASGAGYWITPTIDIRARYEFADIEGLDASHALTFRERLGLKTQEWNGFSAFIEGEFTQAAINDYHGGAAGVTPFDPRNSVVADPETNELNQAYIQYNGFDTIFKAGRQRIIYDNAAFIGNVGWRQNEQTYDSLSLTNTSVSGLTLNYAYINQVNRIFGSDAVFPNSYLGSNIHLLNASYTGVENFTFGGYIYLMDFDDFSVLDNDTYGISAKTKQFGLDLYGEIVYQNNAGVAHNDDSWYANTYAAKTMGKQTLTVGMEHLSAGFRTPLATLHAFNGYADAFTGQRTTGATGGLTDVYVSHLIPLPFGIKWTNTLHAFGDDAISTSRGWEVDSVLAKKFDDHFLAIAKLAHFETEDVLPSTTRVSLELDYTF